MKKHVDYEKIEKCVIEDFANAMINGDFSANQKKNALKCVCRVLAKMSMLITIGYESSTVECDVTVGSRKAEICVKLNDLRRKKDEQFGIQS